MSPQPSIFPNIIKKKTKKVVISHNPQSCLYQSFSLPVVFVIVGKIHDIKSLIQIRYIASPGSLDLDNERAKTSFASTRVILHQVH